SPALLYTALALTRSAATTRSSGPPGGVVSDASLLIDVSCMSASLSPQSLRTLPAYYRRQRPLYGTAVPACRSADSATTSVVGFEERVRVATVRSARPPRRASIRRDLS